MEGGGGGGGGGGGTVCSSKTWFGRTANKFAALTAASGAGGTGASLDADTLATASRLMAESYAYMFGAGGMVTGVLNKDVEDNTGGFEKAVRRVRAAATAAGKPSPATALDVFLAEVAARPLAELRKDRKEGAVTCGLWMSRALLFVGRFGSRLIQTPGATPTEVAKAVYNEVLRPYHGMIIAGVVSMAFSLAPSRVDFFKRMNTLEEDAREELDAFVKHVLPVAEAFSKWFADNNYNFPDKA